MSESLEFLRTGNIAEMTMRIQKLSDRVKKEANEKKKWWGDGLTILDNPEMKGKPLIIRKALAFKKMLTEMPIGIAEGELIVGKIPLGSVAGGRPFPDYATEEEKKAAANKSLSIKSVWGHIVPDYAKVLNIGLAGLKQEVKQELEKFKDKGGSSQEKINLFEAMIICFDSVILFAQRYSKLAKELASNEQDYERKKELEKIAEICYHVPENKPESFYEALQSFWFIFTALHSTLNFSPLGRFDQYMEPFLISDLKKGILTINEAQELLECLWIKTNERTQKKEEYLEDHSDPFDWSLGKKPQEGRVFRQNEDTAYYNQWYQTCVLGGKNKDGSDATNILTYMCLEATKKLKLTQPIIYLRVHKNSPRELLVKCCELIKAGIGMPTIINDETRIPALTLMGISLEEANDYAVSGCWETLIPNKMEFRWTPIHTLKSLELVFNRGYDKLMGIQSGLDTGNPLKFTSFEELKDAFKLQLIKQIQDAVQTVIEYYGESYKIAPVPFLSSLINDCLKKGLDLTQGGARYVAHALSLTGLPNTVNSLAAIKMLVFEKKKIDLGQLINALDNDFVGYEELRWDLINKAPKFGNDDDYVDDIMVEMVDFFVEKVAEYAKECQHIKFPCMIGTTPLYKLFGRLHLASADGRKTGDPLATNLCPSEGTAKKGLTAVIKSHTKCDLLKIPAATELDIHINKKAIESEEGLERLLAVIKTFMDLGGHGLNIVVTDVETLIAAQKEPEKYQDLMVRLGGWQAYFTALDRVHQDYLIAREKH